MSTYTQIRYQLVFGSKNYTSFLSNKNKDPLFKYLFGILKNQKCNPFIVGGHDNHIHCISSLHPSICLSDLIKKIKISSHEWMKNQGDLYKTFPGWQIGYGGFTYNRDATDNLIKYVKNQEEHHREKSFMKELCDLYKEHGIEYQEKYLLI